MTASVLRSPIVDGSLGAAPGGGRPGHIANLTGVRAFAALWVVLYHFRLTEVVSTINLGGIVSGGYLGVDVFFVLSGFILAFNYGNKPPSAKFFDRDFTVRRLARIYPLHAITFVVALAAWAVATVAGYSQVASLRNDWWTAAASVFNVHGWGLVDGLGWNAPSWSVSAEWFAYVILFPILVRLVAPRSTRFGIGVTTILWALFVAYVVLRHDGKVGAVTSDGIFRIIPEFTAGFVLCRAWTSRVAAPIAFRLPVGADGLMIGSLIVLAAIASTSTAGWVLLLPIIVALIAALFAGARITDAVFGNRFVVWLGELSFAVYMVHELIQTCFNQILRRATIAPSVSAALLVLGAEIGVTIVVALAASRWIEIPARRWIVARFTASD